MTRKFEPRQRLSVLRSRWGLLGNDTAAFQEFRNRFMTLVSTELPWHELERDGTEFSFRLIAGAKKIGAGSMIYLENAKSLPDFLIVIQQLLWALEESKSWQRERFVATLERARQYSPGINFRIVRRGTTATLYPEGARELDNALVEEPLHWLAEYPKVAEPFEQALRIVLAKDSEKYRNAFDNLRWSMEQLLKAVLKNRKPLEKQGEALLPWLKQKGLHQQVVNMYVDLLRRFGQYQNDAVKHGDDWQPAELEFVMYVTGALMRLLLQAENTPDVT